MKLFYTSLILVCFFVLAAQARVLTVSNRPGTPAQYATVAAAITAAAAGDTIYINGSETSYGGINIDRRLVIMGAGHNPRKQSILKTTVNIVQFTKTEASGSSIIGLAVQSISYSSPVNNITVKRCAFSSIIFATYGQGWLIEANIGNTIYFSLINSSGQRMAANSTIRNNILSGSIHEASGLIIANNVFIRNANNANALNNIENSGIQNNVFYGVSAQGAKTSTFSNNISYQNTTTFLPYGDNSGANNLVNADPKFTKFPAGGDVFKYEYDFRLQASSPGKNTGTDGTDVGIYGGKGFSETGEPPLPQIRDFFIRNGVVAPNGKLTISLKAEAQN